MRADFVDVWIHLQLAVTGYASGVFIVCHFACMDRHSVISATNGITRSA